MSDAWLNPVTGDYRLTSGAADRDPAGGLANGIYLRLMTPLGSYWADPSIGSRLHELQRRKDLARVAVLAKQYAEQALAPLLASGRITALQVESERQPATPTSRLALRITVTADDGSRLVFMHPVEVI